MSMLCNLYRVDPEQAERLKEFPDAIEELFGQAAPAPPKTGLLARIFGRAPALPKAVEPKFAPIVASRTFEVEGAWHILHFLFSGHGDEGPWPASFLISGGLEIGPDLGYGPARMMDPDRVMELAGFLDARSHDALDAAYEADGIEAARIYWQASPSSEGRRQQLDGLWEIVVGLRGFMRSAADAGDSVIVSIY